MDLGIKGRSAVVTGAPGGVGRAAARILLEEGVRVLLTDIDEAELMGQVDALKGVLIYSVAPSFIATDMTDRMMKKRAEKLGVSMDQAIESVLDEDRPDVVLQRRGRPNEVASVSALLCSERASVGVGSNWRVDGGSVMSIDT